MVRGWGSPRPRSRYSLLCLRTALGGGAATARANQERAPRSRRPGDQEAGVSLRTPLAAVAVAARAPFAPLPSSATSPRPGSKVLLLPACCFPPDPTALQGENCAVDLAEAKGTWGLRAFTQHFKCLRLG